MEKSTCCCVSLQQLVAIVLNAKTICLALANGQLNPYMSSFTLGPRSVFSRRNTYGRNENSEKLYDVRDQLLAAKKVSCLDAH